MPLWVRLYRCAPGGVLQLVKVKELLPSGDEIILLLAECVLDSIASVDCVAVDEMFPLFCSLGDTGSVLAIKTGGFCLVLQLGCVHIVPLDTQDFGRKSTMGATFEAAEQAMQEDMLTGLMGQQGE